MPRLVSDAMAQEVPQWQALQFADAGFVPLNEKHVWQVSSETGYTEDPALLGFDPNPSPHTVVSDHIERQTLGFAELVENNPDRIVIGIPSAPTLRAAQQMEGLNATLAKRPCAGCKSEGERIDARIDQLQREIGSIRGLLVKALADIVTLQQRGLPLPY
jgi:hypothetical protein